MESIPGSHRVFVISVLDGPDLGHSRHLRESVSKAEPVTVHSFLIFCKFCIESIRTLETSKIWAKILIDTYMGRDCSCVTANACMRRRKYHRVNTPHRVRYRPYRLLHLSASASHSRTPIFWTLPARNQNVKVFLSTMEPGIVAGVSITAAVAFRSLIDRVRRSPASSPAQGKMAPTVKRQSALHSVHTIPLPLTSQDNSVVTGNMVLANL